MLALFHTILLICFEQVKINSINGKLALVETGCEFQIAFSRNYYYTCRTFREKKKKKKRLRMFSLLQSLQYNSSIASSKSERWSCRYPEPALGKLELAPRNCSRYLLWDQRDQVGKIFKVASSKINLEMLRQLTTWRSWVPVCFKNNTGGVSAFLDAFRKMVCGTFSHFTAVIVAEETALV